MRINGAHFTPLLSGKVQLGLVHNSQRELPLEELLLQGIEADRKMQTTKLKEILMKDEYPGNDDGWKMLKYFKPKLFSAPDWSKDVVAESLEKLRVLRSARVEVQ